MALSVVSRVLRDSCRSRSQSDTSTELHESLSSLLALSTEDSAAAERLVLRPSPTGSMPLACSAAAHPALVVMGPAAAPWPPQPDTVLASRPETVLRQLRCELSAGSWYAAVDRLLDRMPAIESSCRNVGDSERAIESLPSMAKAGGSGLSPSSWPYFLRPMAANSASMAAMPATTPTTARMEPVPTL